jgi:CDP-glucose 4,6-dehydratase
VIGGGDYAVDRIVPDCVRAVLAGQPLVVRNPSAVRPWQHVLECLSGYLWLGAKLAEGGKKSPFAGAFNFGPQTSSRQPVSRLVGEFLRAWPGEWVDGSDPKNPHEAHLLSLSIEKAGAVLGWYPCWDFSEGIRQTAVWYQERHAKRRADMLEYSVSQIESYVEAAKAAGLAWAS